MLKNLMRLRLNDEEMFHIPHPKLEIMVHVTFKTIQIGTCFGGIVASPAFGIMDYYRGKFS